MGNAANGTRRSDRSQQPEAEYPHPRPLSASVPARTDPAARVSAGSRQMLSSRTHQGRPIMPPSASTAPKIAEHQKASIIRIDVDLKKGTLRLEKDEANPGHYLVTFAFDATLPGSFCIYFLAKEGASCNLTPVKPDAFRPVQEPFDMGLGQNFRQAVGTGVNLSLFSEDELLKRGENEVYALVVRTEMMPRDSCPGAPSSSNEPVGAAPLTNWVNYQTTHAVIEHKEGEYNARVTKQFIWVDGVRYEMQDLYGTDNDGSSTGGIEGNNSGKECIICMSAPTEVTVLPCRHVCLCSKCAKLFRYQTNRCPICRCKVERLLEIRVPANQADQPSERTRHNYNPLQIDSTAIPESRD